MRRVWGLFLLLAVACGTGDATPTAQRVIATPEATGNASVKVRLPKPTSKPKTSTATAPSTKVAAAQVSAPKLAVPLPPAPVVGLGAFKGLGAWIDVFDHHDDPATIVPLVNDMADRGTKTLYLETARYASTTDIQMPKAVGAALDAAKGRGMRVVAWYPPDFADLKRDVRRSVAAIKFRSPNGNRFDAFGADIEYTAGVPDHKKRNASRDRLLEEASQRGRSELPARDDRDPAKLARARPVALARLPVAGSSRRTTTS